jgi:hypothetical protein
VKNITESLAEIKKASATIDEKKQMCLKLGLRPRDVEYLEFSGFFKGLELTFGVEIECLVRRDRVVSAACGTGFNFAYERYNHTDREGYFKFVPDGSLRGENNIECVSPILKDNPDGFDKLKTALDVLNNAGAGVNKSCGLHVHVGVSEYTTQEIVNIYKNYQKLEHIIDSFMAPSRRGDTCRWAYSLQRYDYDGCNTVSDIAAIMNFDRYHKVNPMAYDRHRTVEFRQHQGSVDYTKISMWAKFCCKLVEWSKSHVLKAGVETVNDIPFLDSEEKAFFAGRVAYFSRF